MKVAVVGAGGLGGYLGAHLAAAGADVHLLARGRHLAAIREHGLRVVMPEGELHVRPPASDDPAAGGPSDLVLFCVKSYDTAAAAAGIRPLLHADTAVVSLQNGIDNEDRIAAAIGSAHVLGGVAYLFAEIAEPGVVRASGPRRFAFGELDGQRTSRAERIQALLEAAGITAELSTDIRLVLWTKYTFLVALSGLTAATRLPIGEIRSSTAAWAAFRAVADEVATVGRAEGVALPDDIVERTLALAADLDPGGYSSLHHDLVTGHRMELEALQGTVLRLAARHGITTPTITAIYAILEPWARRNAEEPRP